MAICRRLRCCIRLLPSVCHARLSVVQCSIDRTRPLTRFQEMTCPISMPRPWVSSCHRPIGFPEFVIVIASIMALNPLAMDMMLPALPNVGTAFHIAAANRPQMVLSIFLVGFGVGQFVMGPLSDRFGRRPILLGGMAVYCVASLLAIAAPSFETLLLARALQGSGHPPRASLPLRSFAIAMPAAGWPAWCRWP